MRAVRLSTATLLLFLLAGPVATAGGTVELVSVDVTALPDVSVIVSVPAEVAAADPDAEDFAVVVDGSRVAADVYALVRDAMEVIVLMDTSGSMAGDAITQAAAAAQGFIGGLPASARVAVVSFGDAPIQLTPMGASEGEVAAALTGLTASGETALYDAVVTAASLFTSANSRHVLVVLSDGGDTVSTAGLDDAVAAIDAAAVEVHAVALNTPEAELGALGALSGGSVTTAADSAVLAAAYERVALELTGRYRLTFSTTASGAVEINVFVNAPVGVLSASRRVDLSTGIDTPSAAPAAPPAGFGVSDPRRPKSWSRRPVASTNDGPCPPVSPSSS